MTWVTPQHTSRSVDDAGDTLINAKASVLERTAALSVVNNWRASHAYPLLNFRVTLSNRATAISSKALVYQRLKRLPSILYKLRHPSPSIQGMGLSKMQDIGGCRAVMPTVKGVDNLVRSYQTSDKKNPRRTGVLLWMRDYITTPKTRTGYRGIHLIYEYHSDSHTCRVFNGLRIEIQIRSVEQHYWATAVETAGTFTNQALKSNVGSAEWLRFFVLMANVIAQREDCPLVSGVPTGSALVDELRDLSTKLKVKRTLEGWTVLSKQLASKGGGLRPPRRDSDYYLLALDHENRKIEIISFATKELPDAFEQYALAEVQAENKPETQTVLVAVETIAALQRAYPNYFLDTKAFVGILEQTIK